MASKSIVTYTTLCILFLSLPQITQAETDCAPPALNAFLEASRDILHFTGDYFSSPEAEILCVTKAGQRHTWLGVRWYGPEDGALFALSDNDKRITVLRLGVVQSLRIGPRLQGIEERALWVDYLASQGTGYRLLETVLVTLSGEKIVTLWSHTIFERNFMSPLEEGTEEEYTATSNEDGSIAVSGMLKTFLPPSKMGAELSLQDIKQLKEGKYCWFENIGAYAKCSAK